MALFQEHFRDLGAADVYAPDLGLSSHCLFLCLWTFPKPNLVFGLRSFSKCQEGALYIDHRLLLHFLRPGIFSMACIWKEFLTMSSMLKEKATKHEYEKEGAELTLRINSLLWQIHWSIHKADLRRRKEEARVMSKMVMIRKGRAEENKRKSGR